MRRQARSPLVLFAALLLLSAAGRDTPGSALHQATTEPLGRVAQQGTPVANCRFGITSLSGVTGYDLNALGVGSYLDWGMKADPVSFPGVAYVQVVRLRDAQRRFVLDPAVINGFRTSLQTVATARPGAAWLIGNEPDTTYENQDSLTPDEYAQAYHEAYQTLKAADPTARIGIGTIVQPTPLRLQWLDLMWAAYQQRFGSAPPSDFWSIHSFILNEQAGSWGTGIPPGINVTSGTIYDVQQTDSIAIFKQRLVDFRSWMNTKGERNKPLWITEYGSLMPHVYDPTLRFITFPIERTRDYMLATFDYLLNATDPNTGYPLDENRLVQQWYWYSLNESLRLKGGSLYDPENGGARTIIGDAFINYVTVIAPTINAGFYNLALTPRFPPASVPTTYTLIGQLTNSGNSAVPAGSRIVVSEVAADNSTTEVGSISVNSALAGCGQALSFTATWTETTAANAVQVSVELPAGVTDSDLGDNTRVMYANPFSDVSFSHPFFRYIEALYRGGYTAGCNLTPLMYCPDGIMNRAQSAVFVLRGLFGSGYVPPATTGTFADDWSLGTWAVKWVEGMWAEGLTAGCNVSPRLYCPWQNHTRAEASVFYLRIKYGRSYAPPAATGALLGDVTDTSVWYAKWVEQAYRDGLLPACGTAADGKPLFCPNDLVSRAWAAYMMVQAKNLPLP